MNRILYEEHTKHKSAISPWWTVNKQSRKKFIKIHNSIGPSEYPWPKDFGENCKRNDGNTPYYEKIVRTLTVNKDFIQSSNHILLSNSQVVNFDNNYPRRHTYSDF